MLLHGVFRRRTNIVVSGRTRQSTPFPVAIFHSMEMDFDTRVLSSSTMAMAFGLVMLLVVQRLIGLDSFARSQAGTRG